MTLSDALFLSEGGDLFFNVQHPNDTNTATDKFNSKPFNTGTVGVLTGVNFNNLPANIPSAPVPASTMEQQTVISAIGQYQILGQTGDTFANLGTKGLAGGLGVHYSISTGEEIIKNECICTLFDESAASPSAKDKDTKKDSPPDKVLTLRCSSAISLSMTAISKDCSMLVSR